jgi:RHS repeat-associated protein
MGSSGFCARRLSSGKSSVQSKDGRVDNTDDADGRRTVIKANGQQRISIYDHGGRLLTEVEPGLPVGCKPANDRIFCHGFEQPPATLATTNYFHLGRHLVARKGLDGLHYLHTDALGSLVAETDASKAVTNRYHYLPYGGAFGNAPDGPGYTGAVMEPNGLVYMQARYYDPQLGRFLSTDPVDPDPQSGGNFNRYAYADGNPYNKYDPSGRCATSDVPNADGSSNDDGQACPGQASSSAADNLLDSVDRAFAPLGPDNPIADLKFTGAAIGVGVEATAATSAEKIVEDSPLWRAVKPEELSDIRTQGIFRNLGSAEGKYFSTTSSGAASYAKQAVNSFKDPAYTLVKTRIPKSILMELGVRTVDSNVPAVIVPDNVLQILEPQVLDYFPLPSR